MISKKMFFLLFFTAVLFLGGIAYFILNKEESEKKISLGRCKFDIEESISKESQVRGLSNRDLLCDKCGMLFIFSQSDRYGFWMKDMRFDLDFVWIDGNRVVDLRENIPKDYRGDLKPKISINKVLEINAGKISECKIKIGDKLK